MIGLLIVHAIGAFIWSMCWGMHCSDKQKTFAECACGVSLLLVCWELVTLALAGTAAVVFIKRLSREIEES